MKMSWIEPRIGYRYAVYVLDDGRGVNPRMLITSSGGTNILMGWYPIDVHEYCGALSLKNSDRIDDFAEKILGKYEKRLVA